jgi:peptidoglycan/xylan/chitin deacetylase (PgdA/CDA1 family)
LKADLSGRTALFLCGLLFFLAMEASAAGWADLFVYHRFGDSRYPSTNTSLEDFAAHLETLKQQQIPVLPLGEVVDRLRAGRPLPGHCAVLTVDDGYATFLSGAMPLLRRYGYPATLFVSTGNVGHKGYLNWTELKELAAEGIEIGNHSHSHAYLVERGEHESETGWLGRIREDISQAQRLFRDNLGLEPRLFSYPFGEYTPEIVDLLRGLGFSGAVVQYSGATDLSTDPFLVPRFPMGGSYGTPQGFRAKLGMRPLPVTLLSSPSPLVESGDAPSLKLKIAPSDADLSRLRCYVSGKEADVIRPVPGFSDQREILSSGPLTTRRTPYVLTAPSRDGKGWYWFSHVWIKKGESD